MGKRIKNPDNKLGFGKLLLWQTSSVSVALSTLVLGFVTIYCTDTLGLEPVLVGTLFMVSKFVDGVTDVVAGFIIDRTQTRWGKGRPYEIFMVFLWLSTWLLFSCSVGFSTVAKCVWIFFMYVLMNAVCTTFLNGNNVVYMVRAFKSKEQQVKLTAYGSFFTMGAGLAFNIIFPMAMARIATSAAGWSRLIGMMAVPLTLLGLIRMLTIKEQYHSEEMTGTEKLRLSDIMALARINKPMMLVSAARFLQNAVAGMGVGVYYWTYIIGNVSLMGVTAIATVLGLPLAFLMPSMRRKMGMKKMVIYGFAFSALGYLLIFFAGGNMILVIVAGLITSIGVVPFTMMFNIFIVDCADYNEFKGIPRMEGTMGSLTGLAGKIGSAFGGFILGILMSLSGYDGTAAVQTDAALLMIRMLASIVPLIIFAVIILLLRKYSLDEEMQAVRNAAKEGEQS
jgi:Na+/melibiose symporter-like transporter